MLAAKARLAVAAVTAVAASLALVQPASAQDPGTLMGEILEANLNFISPEPFGEVHVNGECSPDGNTTLTFTASGPAVGPFPGTFTESGTIILVPPGSGPGTSPESRDLQSFDAQFTIDSDLGQVTGTKAKTGPDDLSGGLCFAEPSFRLVNLAFEEVGYEATVTTPTGNSEYSGLAQSSLHTQGVPMEESVRHFVEEFQTSIREEPELTANTAGEATGGGQIPGTSPSKRISFGFEAISTAVAGSSGEFDLQGRCLVQDPALNTTVKCLNVTSYTQAGTHATFGGDALVNDQPTKYTINVDDLQEPNRGQDTFAIVAGDYIAGGSVSNGDTQLHQAR
jgi:hypothetical protein